MTTDRVDQEALLRAKAEKFREVADWFDKAADAEEGDARGMCLDQASEAIEDAAALSKFAAMDGLAGLTDEAREDADDDD